MAKHVLVMFGAADRTVIGDSLAVATSKAIADLETRSGRPLSEDSKQAVRDGIKSQRENEKELLKAAFQAYATKVKKELDVIVECGLLMRTIDKAEFSVELTDHEVDMFKKALPQMEHVEYWTLYVDLLTQLNTPRYKEDEGKVTT